GAGNTAAARGERLNARDEPLPGGHRNRRRGRESRLGGMGTPDVRNGGFRPAERGSPTGGWRCQEAGTGSAARRTGVPRSRNVGLPARRNGDPGRPERGSSGPGQRRSRAIERGPRIEGTEVPSSGNEVPGPAGPGAAHGTAECPETGRVACAENRHTKTRLLATGDAPATGLWER